MNDTNHAARWLDGKISMGKLLELEGVPFAQGSDLIGGLMNEIHARAIAFDDELKRRIKVSDEFKTLAEGGDKQRTVPSDVIAEPIRASALQEARNLLRIHILGGLERTGQG